MPPNAIFLNTRNRQSGAIAMSRFSQPTRRIRVNLVLSLALLFLSSNALAATDQAKRLITVDDKFAFQSVASPVFSPDGKWIAYTVRTRNFAENSSTQRIWLIPTKGGAAIPMTSALVSSGQPVFSRDGSLLYFLSTRGDQKSQVWSLNLRSGGEGQQVTRLERGINQINFSPDEKKLLLVLKDEDKSEPLVEGSKPWVVNRLDFKKDYQGYVGNLRSHIYVYDIATNQLSQVTSGDFDDSEPTWSPDGSQVAFTSNRNQKGDENSDIWLVSANGGAEARKITTSKGADSSPTWHPDGKWLAYRAAQSGVEPNYATQHLARIKTDGSGSEFLTEEIDRNINNLQFSETGEHLYFLIEDSGEQHLARMHWKDKKVERLVAGKFVVGAFSVSNSGQLAGIISSLQRPSELFIQREDEPVIVTSVNDELINQLKLASTEEIHFKAPDGWPIEGFVTLPPGYKAGQRYPVILKIHGGPVSQYNHGFNSRRPRVAVQPRLLL
jgi:dipeptidyl aminopeptidase/acylaminoacyl peptidase